MPNPPPPDNHTRPEPGSPPEATRAEEQTAAEPPPPLVTLAEEGPAPAIEAAPAAAPPGGRQFPSAEDVPPTWQVGDLILDTYRVTGLLGQGGMGTVYKVHHQGWNIDLAVKSPKPGFFNTETTKENYIREAETWISLGLHPHIVSCHYVRTLGDIPRVFAEFVAGGSLAAWIRSGRLLTGGPEAALERLLDIAIQFAWGLHYAHEQGLIHQDVKPDNVMLTAEGLVKVTDFGLAHARPVETEEIPDGQGGTLLVKGRGLSPAYCSPEQANGELLSRRTDIWSWAVSIMEMLTGAVTWQTGIAALSILNNLREDKKTPPVIPLPPALDDLLARCFQTDPAARPATMAAVAAEVQQMYRQVVGREYTRPEPQSLELQADSLNNHAISLLDLGRHTEAEQLFEQALTLRPDHPEALYNQGLLQWRTARLTDEALLRRLTTARRGRPEEWRYDYLLGLVHAGRGDGDNAVQALETALTASNGDSQVRHALEEVRQAREQWGGHLRTFVGHKDVVTCVAITPDGRFVLSGSADKTLRLWNLKTDECERIFEGHRGTITSVAVSPDGQQALSGSHDHHLRLWDLATGQCLKTFHANADQVSAVAIAPDGQTCMYGFEEKTLVGLSNLARGWGIRTFGNSESSMFNGLRQGRDGISSVVISPDGQKGLCGCKDEKLRLLNLSDGECQVLTGHSGVVTSVTISSDGRLALSGGEDRTVRLWDLITGKCLKTYQGHSSAVTSVAISSDGQLALSSSDDMTVRLWDLRDGQVLRVFDGHKGSVKAVAISPNNQWGVSGSDDAFLRTWIFNAGNRFDTRQKGVGQ